MWVKVLTWVLALLFVAAGVPKVLGVESVATEFAHMGYSNAFRLLIGVLEIAGGVALLIPAAAVFGAAMLLVIMAGAVWTLVSLGQPPIPPLVVGALLAVVLVMRVRGATR